MGALYLSARHRARPNQEIAQKTAGSRVYHLGEQAQVVGASHHLTEALLGLLCLPCDDQVADEPETQEREGNIEYLTPSVLDTADASESAKIVSDPC